MLTLLFTPHFWAVVIVVLVVAAMYNHDARL